MFYYVTFRSDGSLGDQLSPNVLDRSSPNFQDWQTYRWGYSIWHPFCDAVGLTCGLCLAFLVLSVLMIIFYLQLEVHGKAQSVPAPPNHRKAAGPDGPDGLNKLG